jgi:hypothetical protein
MARRIVSMTTIVPTGFGDTASMTDNTYPFLLRGGSGTQLNKIWELSISGLAASSSSVTPMLLSRDSTVGTGTNTNGAGETDTALDPATAALAAPALTGNSNATVKPQRDVANHLANAGLNAFGGVYFWRANRLEECFTLLGASASNGEASLSSFTGGTPGAIGAHMIYESL